MWLAFLIRRIFREYILPIGGGKQYGIATEKVF
jgi:hypothetical protein